ncbi:GPW/gp25 family protein [Bradyrhizobium sp. USDA 3458]|uniref:GPW/gp25 family protein n=1 Tax=Bradyrhizobium sp. USDA 3458 TaxID=2591461 RepID=UPI0011445B3F|nr:GPW/gp25 family protein [Bradyrhizobium sp. USDA 3458]
MFVEYPYHFDGRHRTAEALPADHVRQLIEQLLFTQPGERVNRPDFGSGVMQLVFSAGSPEVAASAEYLIRGVLQQFLADRILVSDVSVEARDARLEITIDYTILATGEAVTATFEREIGP